MYCLIHSPYNKTGKLYYFSYMHRIENKKTKRSIIELIMDV